MVRRLKLLTPLAVVVVAGMATAVAEAASSPTVATGASTSLTTSSVVVHGAVRPNAATTSYQFELGLTTTYDILSPVRSAGHGVNTLAVAHQFSALLPGTVYHYRLIATNKFGSTAGADRSFKTRGNPPPDLATGAATVTGPSNAIVTGLVNPHGVGLSYWFQYGVTTNPYPSLTPAQPLPAGTAPVAVSAPLSGLAPFSTFHYRLVVQRSSLAPQGGADATFLTYPVPSSRPVPRVPDRTTPGRDRHKPYVFTTTGSVVGPASIPGSTACFGNAAIHFLLGRRVVAFDLVPVLPNCTFSATVAFQRLPGHGKKGRKVHLRALVHFRGNGYLAPADSRAKKVTLG